ncbi:phosphoribosyltransferase [Halostreptopolyspora alba]|uniref:Phosphoribosyltransferase n=1 Tax=Halostreptopolyspora alba TaxID=2487137 RepID=A0A3N0ECL0_9ACTN|nr:phosphoribosyltransferase [Nocardiopsaceae bacterium YIM 96095]
MPFNDRAEAGQRLATELRHLNGEDLVVLALPRGGVPVAFEIATTLGAPLDVIVVRKLGVPHHPELAMGAIGEGGARVINDRVTATARVTPEQITRVEENERAELQDRIRALRGERPATSVRGRTAIVVDDGIATGSTAQAACQVARVQGATRVVLAVPVGSPESVERLREDADIDEVTCLEAPPHFSAISQFYRDFSQTSNEEVTSLLDEAARSASRGDPRE